MVRNHPILLECLKQRLVWCVTVLIGTWFYLLSRQSYGACAATGAFTVMAVFGVVGQFVLSQITAETITVIPDLGHD